MKLGPRRNYHKGRVAIRHYANQPARPLVGVFSVIVKTGCGTDGALHSTCADSAEGGAGLPQLRSWRGDGGWSGDRQLQLFRRKIEN